MKRKAPKQAVQRPEKNHIQAQTCGRKAQYDIDDTHPKEKIDLKCSVLPVENLNDQQNGECHRQKVQYDLYDIVKL